MEEFSRRWTFTRGWSRRWGLRKFTGSRPRRINRLKSGVLPKARKRTLALVMSAEMGSQLTIRCQRSLVREEPRKEVQEGLSGASKCCIRCQCLDDDQICTVSTHHYRLRRGPPPLEWSVCSWNQDFISKVTPLFWGKVPFRTDKPQPFLTTYNGFWESLPLPCLPPLQRL